jgi:hypothetical protein
MPTKKRRKAEFEPDARITIDERDTAMLCLSAPLTPGCFVALAHSDKAPRFGRYWPGPPAEFAEMVDHWDNGPEPAVRRRTRVASGWVAYPWIETHRRYR